ncbi:MAG: hypothetical protein ACD_59C00075G0002 [uncultured bacterium]|nr:MAG: hypothetical protein ACD_59C00075G0002 [uncultured bacterium]
MIYINIAVEDELSEAVIRKLLPGNKFQISQCFRRGGFGYLKNNLKSFNAASKFIPYLVLTDLDASPCPLKLISEWLNFPKNYNLIFRIAVKEVESWLIADKNNFSKFMSVSKDLIRIENNDVDKMPNPKEFIINLAKRSKNREIKSALIPLSNAKIGPDYNAVLSKFVCESWDFNEAAKHSKSLLKTIKNIDNFKPER